MSSEYDTLNFDLDQYYEKDVLNINSYEKIFEIKKDSKKKNNETLISTNCDDENESENKFIYVEDEYEKRKKQKNNMENGKNIGKNKNKKKLKRKDVIAKYIKSNIQSDIHKSFKPFLKKDEKLKKIKYKFIENNSSLINRKIFSKTIKEFLLINEDNKKLIEELEKRGENNELLFRLLNMTYYVFIKKIFTNPNNEFEIDNSKYKIQKLLYDNDEINGFILYYKNKRDRQLQIDPERDGILGLRPKNTEK